MKKIMKLLLVTLLFVITSSSTVFAAGWRTGAGENNQRWWYELDGNQYYSGAQNQPNWQWLDGNQDGIAECYAFDQEGWMYADSTTPDGYQVNRDGAWIVNGTVQIKTVNTTGQSGKVLIAYFSRTGTTRTAANQIQSAVGGEMYEITVVNAYPPSYQATTEQARRELDSNARPALTSSIVNMAEYDTILIGYPIWYGTAPMPVLTFLESYDFTGKTVVPFCTSGGSGISGSLAHIRSAAGNGTVLEGMQINGAGTAGIQQWLQRIGVSGQSQ